MPHDLVRDSNILKTQLILEVGNCYSKSLLVYENTRYSCIASQIWCGLTLVWWKILPFCGIIVQVSSVSYDFLRCMGCYMCYDRTPLHALILLIVCAF